MPDTLSRHADKNNGKRPKTIDETFLLSSPHATPPGAIAETRVDLSCRVVPVLSCLYRALLRIACAFAPLILLNPQLDFCKPLFASPYTTPLDYTAVG
jgi:hypothetical protein